MDVQQISQTFKKRELVITTQEQYPQDIMVEFTQDKTDLLNAYKEGDEVKVSINIRGREWINPEGVAKYFNTIQVWRIESFNPAEQGQAPAADYVQPSFTNSGEDDDDLPF